MEAKRIAVPQRQLQRARSMRKKMTEPERKLWRALRQRLPVEGSHFRRQVPIGPYIVDFCCQGTKLVIEADGNQHGTDEAIAFDANRTALIEAHGFRVLRFSNFDVIFGQRARYDLRRSGGENPHPRPLPTGPAPGHAQARPGWGGEELRNA